MNEKGNVVAELREEKWLWDLALLCDSHHKNYLNTKRQVQQRLIFHMFAAVRTSEIKLNLFQKHLECAT
jgi:hypothetical protein